MPGEVDVKPEEVPTSALGALGEAGIVPLVLLDDAADALPVAHALVAGGLAVLELALRTPAAWEALAILSHDPEYDGVLGAGTVRTPDEARRAIEAGAGFVVTPGLDVDIVATCHSAGVPVLPGVATATEALAAHRLGLDIVKFFPAATNGGLAALDALAGPFFDMWFVPTGGVDLRSASRYLAHSRVWAVAGSWLVPRSAVAAADWTIITAGAAEASDLVRRVRGDAGS
jgi:2-dehydro-3-deoxyphosphogluconate aldolase/(4S)-4-hydroxy-2-oxoglutarate aldolase